MSPGSIIFLPCAAKNEAIREKVLTEEQKEPLKAILAFETLVHPDHPLRRKGYDGIDMSIGALPDFSYSANHSDPRYYVALRRSQGL